MKPFRQSSIVFYLFSGTNEKSDTPANLEERRIVEQLWQELRPLHELIHAYIRKQIARLYPGLIEFDQPIPVHLTSKYEAKSWKRISFYCRGSIRFDDDTSRT